MATLIRFLGPPMVERDRRPSPGPPGAKSWAVLCYLALAERPPSRRWIAELLFATASDPLGALRWTICAIHRALGSMLELGGDPLSLALGDDVETDVEIVLRGAWARAVALGCLDGALLEGREFPGCDAFESWLLVERSRLRSAAVGLLVEAAHSLHDQDRPHEAAQLAARAVTRDPFDEAAHQLLVLSLAGSGDRRAADLHAAASRDLFERELGVLPALSAQPTGSELVAAPTLVPDARRVATVSSLQVGKAALDAGAVVTGLEHLRNAVTDAAAMGDARLSGASLVSLGGATVHAVACRDRQAAVALRHSLSLARHADDRHTAVTALRELAFVDLCTGHRDRSLGRLDDACQLADGDDRDVAAVLAVRGMNLIDGGQYGQALRTLSESVARAERADRSRQAAWSLSMIGRAHLMREDHELAGDAFEVADRLVDAQQWVALQPWTEALNAENRLRAGRVDMAEAALQHAWQVGNRLDDHVWRAIAARGLGLVDAARGNEARARGWLDQSLAAARWKADRYVWIEAFSLDAFCDVAVAYGWVDAAAAIETLWSIATAGDLHEFVARADIHRSHHGDRTAGVAARALADEIDNPALTRLLAHPAGARFTAL